MSHLEENSSSAMAKLQRLQDELSQFFSISIRILSRDDLKSLTVESNGHTRCLTNRGAHPDICERFILRVIDLDPGDVMVSMCPFGLLSAIVPLGKSMWAGLHEEKARYFFLAVHNPAYEGAGGVEVEQKRTVTSIVSGMDLHDKIEFVARPVPATGCGTFRGNADRVRWHLRARRDAGRRCAWPSAWQSWEGSQNESER